MRFLLAHGGWQGGWCWDGVAEHLRSLGHEVHAPTLRGLEPEPVRRTDLPVSAMADDLAELVRQLDLRELIAVGHSGGGPIIQLLREREPDRLARLVFVDAWVALDGECVYDVLPAPLAESLRAAADADPDRLIPMPPEFWRAGLLNDVPTGEADRWLTRVVPTPDRWMSEPLSLPGFAGAGLPASYVFPDDDVSVPRATFERCAARLPDPSVTTSPGSHEAMLSRPVELAGALLRVCR